MECLPFDLQKAVVEGWLASNEQMRLTIIVSAKSHPELHLLLKSQPIFQEDFYYFSSSHWVKFFLWLHGRGLQGNLRGYWQLPAEVFSQLGDGTREEYAGLLDSINVLEVYGLYWEPEGQVSLSTLFHLANPSHLTLKGLRVISKPIKTKRSPIKQRLLTLRLHDCEGFSSGSWHLLEEGQFSIELENCLPNFPRSLYHKITSWKIEQADDNKILAIDPQFPLRNLSSLAINSGAIKGSAAGKFFRLSPNLHSLSLSDNLKNIAPYLDKLNFDSLKSLRLSDMIITRKLLIDFCPLPPSITGIEALELIHCVTSFGRIPSINQANDEDEAEGIEELRRTHVLYGGLKRLKVASDTLSLSHFLSELSAAPPLLQLEKLNLLAIQRPSVPKTYIDYRVECWGLVRRCAGLRELHLGGVLLDLQLIAYMLAESSTEKLVLEDCRWNTRKRILAADVQALCEKRWGPVEKRVRKTSLTLHSCNVFEGRLNQLLRHFAPVLTELRLSFEHSLLLSYDEVQWEALRGTRSLTLDFCVFQSLTKKQVKNWEKIGGLSGSRFKIIEWSGEHSVDDMEEYKDEGQLIFSCWPKDAKYF